MEAPMIYELRAPNHTQAGKVYPAIFLMHGIGSNEKNMLSLMDGLEESFYIFSIRGQLSQPPGYAFFTIQGYGNPHREVFDESISRLTSFIEYAVDQYPLDQTHLYTAGFSQGAILAMTLGLTLGERIKGIVALSGYIPAFVKEEYTLKPVDKVSVFISHGEIDRILPYEWGKESAELFKNLGATVDFKSYSEDHIVSVENKNDFHQWLISNKQD